MNKMEKRSQLAAESGQLSSAPYFLLQARQAVELSTLTQLFSEAIRSLGFRHHVCARPLNSGLARLFGDAPAEWLEPTGARPAMLSIAVTNADGEERRVLLYGEGCASGARLRPQLEALASTYVGFGEPLLECSQDVPTCVGLGVTQRECLKLALAGRGDADIAEIVGVSPLAVAKHIEHAAALLNVSSRSGAIAVAAARGWLSVVTVAGLQQTRQ